MSRLRASAAAPAHGAGRHIMGRRGSAMRVHRGPRASQILSCQRGAEDLLAIFLHHAGMQRGREECGCAWPVWDMADKSWSPGEEAPLSLLPRGLFGLVISYPAATLPY